MTRFSKYFREVLCKEIIKSFILVAILLLYGTLQMSRAGTYYVNNSGSPACSNSTSNGSKSQPWCTISYGVSNLQSGDTLYVMAGTYNETLYIYGPAGTSAKWTVIKAYPGNVVNLIGSGVSSGRIKILNTSYMAFEGFNITNYNHGINVENSHNIRLLNCKVHHVGQQGITIHYDSHYITVENCMVHDTRQWQYNGEGFYIGTSSSGPLDNTSHVTIKNSIIYNVTDEGIELKPGTHDCLVEGNLLYNIMTDPDYSGSAGAIEINQATINCPTCVGGLQTWPSNPNHVISNNIVHSSRTGIRAGTGSTVYNNVVYNIPDPYSGILVNNFSADDYPRKIYHNTVDLPVPRAIVVSSASADVKNNIGPSLVNNLASNPAFFVSVVRGSEDYHLVSGSDPVDAGVITNIPNDKDGNVRPQGGGYDMGAYEYISATHAQTETLSDQSVKIYPNPAREKLYFENNSTRLSTMNAEIYNILGEKLMDTNIDLITEKMLDISGLSPGIYFVQLSSKTTHQHSKIVIAH